MKSPANLKNSFLLFIKQNVIIKSILSIKLKVIKTYIK